MLVIQHCCALVSSECRARVTRREAQQTPRCRGGGLATRGVVLAPVRP